MPDQPAKPAKRRVKSPETFRERAVKAADASDKPKRSARLKRAGGQIVTPVFRPAGKASGRVFGSKPFKPVAKVLRVIGKIIFPPYLRNSWQELRLVTWPSWKESRRLTGAVLIFAVIFGAAIALVDYGLDKVFKSILLK